MADKNIELRSEKVRSIIGKTPPILLRIGITVITIVIVVVLALMYYIPYPQTVNIDIFIENNSADYYAKGIISVKDARAIKVGQDADVLLFNLDGDYLLKGSVSSIITFGGDANVSIKITSSHSGKTHLSSLPLGYATIITSNTSILKRMLKK